jgi:hypothetical protein
MSTVHDLLSRRNTIYKRLISSVQPALVRFGTIPRVVSKGWSGKVGGQSTFWRW